MHDELHAEAENIENQFKSLLQWIELFTMDQSQFTQLLEYHTNIGKFGEEVNEKLKKLESQIEFGQFFDQDPHQEIIALR
jgi:hypothetical protein